MSFKPVFALCLFLLSGPAAVANGNQAVVISENQIQAMLPSMSLALCPAMLSMSKEPEALKAIEQQLAEADTEEDKRALESIIETLKTLLPGTLEMVERYKQYEMVNVSLLGKKGAPLLLGSGRISTPNGFVEVWRNGEAAQVRILGFDICNFTESKNGEETLSKKGLAEFFKSLGK